MAKATKDAATGEGLDAAERAAIKERAKETRRAKPGKDLEPELLAKIGEMTGSDREIAERVHAIVRATAPHLAPRTWYGQPAYAKDGQVLVFFQGAGKFGTRYATLGFNEAAALDEGGMWPTAFAITGLTDADVKKIRTLVKKAAG